MPSILKIIGFILVLLVGSFLIYGFSGLAAMYIAAFTGIGAVFTFLRPTLLILFWVVMARIFVKKIYKPKE